MLPAAKHELWFALRQFRFFGNNTIMSRVQKKQNYKAAETSVMLQTCIIKKNPVVFTFLKVKIGKRE